MSWKETEPYLDTVLGLSSVLILDGAGSARRELTALTARLWSSSVFRTDGVTFGLGSLNIRLVL